MRDPNGFDHVSFLLQLIQVCPVVGALIGTLTSEVWLLRAGTVVLLAGSWVTASRLSSLRLLFRRRELIDEHTQRP